MNGRVTYKKNYGLRNSIRRLGVHVCDVAALLIFGRVGDQDLENVDIKLLAWTSATTRPARGHTR